ncbi:MAG: NAD-dependent epimerase/dehydratase family protein [Acidimicrobiales bacterium]
MTAPSAAGPVLVTGGTGFVGANLVRRLVADGRPVHVLGRAGTDAWRLAPVADRITRHDVDLADPASRRDIGNLVAALAPAAVFHLAAAPLVAGVGINVDQTIEVNVFGSHAVLEAAAAVEGCAIVTTGDAFEHCDLGRPLRELDADGAQPTSIHGITRLAATRAARRLAAATDASISTVRLFSVLGPLDHPQRLVPRLFAAARDGSEVALSVPAIVRDWVHVDDVVDLYLRIATQVPEGTADRLFNAGAGVAVTLGELVEEIESVTGSPIRVRWGAFSATEHDGGHWVADPSHTKAVLGWTAAPLGEALVRLAADR